MSRPVQCIGMKVDAFILNPSVISDRHFVAPISRPAYEGLLPGHLNLRHDFVPPIDVRNAFPWQHNSRIADLATGEVIKSRLGIYLHWCVPKVFRSGNADAGGQQKSTDGLMSERAGSGTVEYKSIPDRWLVFRHVTKSEPSSSPAPALEVFLVESNRIRKLDDVIAAGEDVETATAVFLDPDRSAEDQLRTVLGRVSHLAQDWSPGAGGVENQEDAAREGYHCPFTVLETGNTLFADYTAHNAGVFTLHDNLSWDGQAPGSTESAKVSYVVYGYSAKDARELLSPPTEQSSRLEFSDPESSLMPVRICWGSLYFVSYDRSAPPSLVKAAGMAQNFAENQPVAVGSDVLDACVAMLGSSLNAQESSISDVLRGLNGAAALPESNSQLDRATTARTNFKTAHGGYRWRLAKDESKTVIPGSPMAPTEDPGLPKPEQISALRRLNRVQSYLDALYRRKRYVRHLIFCEWWKHRSLQGDDEVLSQQRRTQAISQARLLLQRMEMVNLLLAAAEGLIKTVQLSEKPYGPFAREENRKFFSHTDPSFAIRDMGSGWPADWASAPSALSKETIDSWLSSNASDIKKWVNTSPFSKSAAPTKDARIPDVWEEFLGHRGIGNLPKEMGSTLKNIMMVFTRELDAVTPGNKPLITNPSWKECCWDGQPWLPLFVEWEAEYVHIPLDMWELRHSDDGTVQYGLRGDRSFSDYKLGSRSFSGRAILLPDAQKLIVGLMKMIYGTVPGAAGKENKEQTWAEKLLGSISLSFGRLDGFTDHLLTLYQGGHVVPSRERVQPRSDDDALIRSILAGHEAGEEIFVNQDALRLLYGSLPGDSADAKETAGGLDVTPYGADHEGLSYTAAQNTRAPDHKDLFFRPATHGQARLTQFKIVDRFGQVICAADPRLGQPPKPFYPNMGPGVLCEPRSGVVGGKKEPNTALALTPEEIARGDCSWFQLGPRINQDARLNAAFMCDQDLPDGEQTGGKYRPVATGERAVFAWLLINFHNRSLQVYDSDGSFKGEAYLPSEPDEPVYWQSLVGRGEGPDILPHMLPREYDPLLAQRLERMAKDRISTTLEGSSSLPMSLVDLVISMSHGPFLIDLWKTIVAAQDHMQAPTSQHYAQFPSALVGRPLALARLGLGIELATAPMRSQAYADHAESYAAERETAPPVVKDTSETTGDEELTHYDFAVKLGDFLGQQDGFVAYFAPPASDASGGAWTIMTDFTARDNEFAPSPYVQHSSNAPPLTVSPRYPRLLPPPAVTRETLDIAEEVINYELRAAESLYPSIVTVLIDPFLPVNVRSAILPTVTAQLNRAVVERDLKYLGVWLRAGPILIGARGADPVSSEEGKVRIQVVEDDAAPPEGLRVPVHTPPAEAGGAQWRWVQPVRAPLPEEDETSQNSGGIKAALEAPVNYIRLGVMQPLKTGFDSVAGPEVESEEYKGQEVDMAVALDGYLLLK